MKDLRQVSISFIKRSKVLTLSCIISVAFAVILIISMWNFSLNATNSYKQSLKSAYGDCDMLVTYENHENIEKDIIAQINNIDDVEAVSSGRFDSNTNIEGNTVYTIGAIDSDMMKSRYHYTVDLKESEIIINQTLADCLNKAVGDSVTFDNVKLKISEIIEDKTYSAENILMAIMPQITLTQATGVSNNANFIMVKTDEHASQEAVSKQIKGIDRAFDVLLVEADALYKDNIESFAVFIKLLAIIVLLVAGLFVTSIFQSFLYKYNHDMAVIRAMGGTAEQIKYIFINISISINTIACGIGFIISIFINKVILQVLNQRLRLIEGEIEFYGFASSIITLLVFGIIMSLLFLSILKNLKVLPIEAIVNNEIRKIGKGKKKSSSKSGMLLHRLFGKEVFLGIKLIIPKMKENLFLILTIMMIILLSLVGGSLNSLIQANNNKYMKDQYLTDIVVTDNSLINFSNTIQIYDEINASEGVIASMILTNGEPTEMSQKEGNVFIINYHIADLEAMQKQGILKNEVQQENRIVISTETAKDLGIIAGDTVYINTPTIYERDDNGFSIGILKKSIKQEFLVSTLMSRAKMNYCDVYIDLPNVDFIQEYMGLSKIFITGDLDMAESVLENIKIKYPSIKWSNYQEVMDVSSRAIKERFLMFEMVISLMILVTGFGWFNSMRSIILSRTREYSILRV